QRAGIFHDQSEPVGTWGCTEIARAQAHRAVPPPQEIDHARLMLANSQGRLQDRRPLSIIDIGSNSIRLVIYEGLARSPTVLFNEKMLAGLGRGMVSTGRLDPKAVTRSLEEFRRFRSLSEQAGAAQMYVLATAAAREAVNGADFIRRAED